MKSDYGQIILNILGVVIATAIVICVAIGVYSLKRKVNYNLSYKSMVEQTVKEMVKPEALK